MPFHVAEGERIKVGGLVAAREQRWVPRSRHTFTVAASSRMCDYDQRLGGAAWKVPLSNVTLLVEQKIQRNCAQVA
ncbi:hypothetical protein [Bradyrhizobium manausense]|uniref:Uncharacterized protein n=1 Tax=Bradyrhizobium manausense TaxID=989370 RepID=A0A0R3CWW1_9BRAD|nr:hypothetical protein [Bradyrhizobium manausense]KRQ02073.1 hypothetical protein AOQ71_36415 [Bradyrhizobium manausense]